MTNATSPPTSPICPPPWSTSNTIFGAGTPDEAHEHRREIAGLQVGWSVETANESLEPIEVGLYVWHHAEPRPDDPAPGVALSVPTDSFGVRYLSYSQAIEVAASLLRAAALLEQRQTEVLA